MSRVRQQVVRGPSLMGWGKRPLRTPAHQVAGLTGISCNTAFRRKSPDTSSESGGLAVIIGLVIR